MSEGEHHIHEGSGEYICDKQRARAKVVMTGIEKFHFQWYFGDNQRE